MKILQKSVSKREDSTKFIYLDGEPVLQGVESPEKQEFSLKAEVVGGRVFINKKDCTEKVFKNIDDENINLTYVDSEKIVFNEKNEPIIEIKLGQDDGKTWLFVTLPFDSGDFSKFAWDKAVVVEAEKNIETIPSHWDGTSQGVSPRTTARFDSIGNIISFDNLLNNKGKITLAKDKKIKVNGEEIEFSYDEYAGVVKSNVNSENGIALWEKGKVSEEQIPVVFDKDCSVAESSLHFEKMNCEL